VKSPNAAPRRGAWRVTSFHVPCAVAHGYNHVSATRFFNLYTHFVFTTQDRFPCISEIHRERIEKYITGIVNNHQCKMYAIYANPEHVHFLVSRDPAMGEKEFTDEYGDFLRFYQNTLSEKIRE